MANATDVVGYSYDAALHCIGCTLAHFNVNVENRELLDTREDGEGNPVHPVFVGPDAFDDCRCCLGDGEHEVTAPDCAPSGRSTVDCEECDGLGQMLACCDDCGEELVS